MPLQNRVRPDGEIIATPHRGMLMGNRGGRLHLNGKKKLHPTRRWASRHWISCVTQFRGRQRELMMDNRYTELFFLDEVTALAAGHRPCFECRRADAVTFAEAWQSAHDLQVRPRVDEMDRALHQERLLGREKRTHMHSWSALPEGSCIRAGETLFMKHDNRALRWSFEGYRETDAPAGKVDCLTPPSILAVLNQGYRPLWHPSAEAG